jgi:hypothetical protein
MKAPSTLVGGYYIAEEAIASIFRAESGDSGFHRNVCIHASYDVTFQKTESRMNHKAHQFPEDCCLDADRRQKIKPHTLEWTCMGATLRTSAYSVFCPKDDDRNWLRRLVTICQNRRCHIPQGRKLKARYVLHWFSYRGCHSAVPGCTKKSTRRPSNLQELHILNLVMPATD